MTTAAHEKFATWDAKGVKGKQHEIIKEIKEGKTHLFLKK